MSDLAAWQRLHPAWVIYGALRSLRALVLPIALAFLTGGGSAPEWFGLAFGVVLIGGALVIRAVLWTKTAYHVDQRGVRLATGLLSRNERFLPAHRVQAVEVHEGVLHRLLRVVAVKIESAAGAGSGADITLEALARGEAERLRSLLVRQIGHAPAPAPDQTALTTDGAAAVPEEGEFIAAVSLARLVVAGATSGRIGPALGVVAAAFQFGDDVLPGDAWERVVDALPEPTLAVVSGAVLAAAILAWLFAIVSTLLTYGNFELRRLGDRLQATYGLLERRRISIPLARVQAVVISEGLLRQPFGLAAVRAESAGYGKDTAESGVLMPILHWRELPALLERACPAYALDPATVRFERPPDRAQRRYVMGPVWVVLVLVAVALAPAIAIDRLAWLWGLAPAVLLPPAALLGWLKFRDDGWQVRPDGLFVLRGRPFHRVTTITAVRRVQHRAVVQSPLQRRARLVSFVAAVASGGSGGTMGIAHIDQDDGERLVELLSFVPKRGPARA
jgi:putative membrane protein